MTYDVFISFKCSDEDKNYTRDYAIAREIKECLVLEGYSVFFSSDSLEQMGSSMYKADIDDALDSSKLMVVVLTKAEYALSHWVHYEWDSFYNDYLSGIRKEANLFTVTLGLNIHDLPRTLRNVQNYPYEFGIAPFIDCVKSALPKQKDTSREIISEPKNPSKDLVILTGKQLSEDDIRQAVQLDALVYDDSNTVNIERCLEWFNVNPDIYVMAKESSTGRIIAYVNICPVTDECYERIKLGDFIDSKITSDMILGYDMPFPYSVYFCSIVVHPDYQNTEVFLKLFNSIISKFIYLGEHEVYVKRMVADAVTANGEKFCKLFGMEKVKGSDHHSTLYEISMIPPKFKILSKMTKKLSDYYRLKYLEAPYLFE